MRAIDAGEIWHIATLPLPWSAMLLFKAKMEADAPVTKITKFECFGSLPKELQHDILALSGAPPCTCRAGPSAAKLVNIGWVYAHLLVYRSNWHPGARTVEEEALIRATKTRNVKLAEAVMKDVVDRKKELKEDYPGCYYNYHRMPPVDVKSLGDALIAWSAYGNETIVFAMLLMGSFSTITYWNAQIAAAAKGHASILQSLLVHMRWRNVLARVPNDALVEAAKEGHLEVVETMLTAEGGRWRADVHYKDDDALCWAAYNGHARVVGALVRAGANVRARGDEPLRAATRYGHVEVVGLLMAAGAAVASR